MKGTTRAHLPKMRKQGLIVDKLPDEVLVYDTDRHKAHCLNHTAALVWQRCDGRTSPREIARKVALKTTEPFSEDMVLVALRQLDKNHLLEQSFELPPKLAGLSRREMMRVLGIAAVVTVPLITSIVAPNAADAATCATVGQNCTSKACCPGLVCDASQTPKKCV